MTVPVAHGQTAASKRTGATLQGPSAPALASTWLCSVSPGPVQDHVPAPQPPPQLPTSTISNPCTFEDPVVCPICLEEFHSPVTTACGHNFCMTCLQGFWNYQATMGETLDCPQCRESFPSRPRLCKNIVLEDDLPHPGQGPDLRVLLEPGWAQGRALRLLLAPEAQVNQVVPGVHGLPVREAPAQPL